MINEKLKTIGKKLDVPSQDIRKIQRCCFKNKILYWIVNVVIAVISFIIGFFVGGRSCPSSSTPLGSGGGYPFGLVIPSMLSRKKKGSKIAILSLSAITLLIAIKSYPVFGQAIKYNVYRK